MNLEQLKDVWNDHDRKLDKNLKLNLRILREMNLDKTKSKMRTLMILRIAEASFFFIIVIYLWIFIADNFFISAPAISAFVLNVFATVGLAGGIWQIALIGMIDYAGPVTSIQKQLAKIKSHGIRILKLIILSIPFYMAYIFLGSKLLFGIDLYEFADFKWLAANIILSLCLIFPTLWLYKELSMKAPTRKWVKTLIEDVGGKQITAALEILNEIEKFEDGEGRSF